jgi:hypothetical protein
VQLQWRMTKDAYTFRYRVRNWSHYNQALIARGGITFWIDEAALTTQDLLGYGDTMRIGCEECVPPQPTGRSRVCILGAEPHETRLADPEL